MLDDEQRVARRLEPVEHVQQRLGVGRVQAGGGLVEHVDDAEQPRAQLGGDPQALRLAGRQRRRAAPEAEVAEAEVEQHLDPRDQVGADPDRDLGRLPGSASTWRPRLGELGDRPQQRHELGERQRVDLGDGAAGEGHGERLGPQAAAVALGAGHAPHEPQRPVAHPLALGVGEHVHDVLAGAPELARGSRSRRGPRSGLMSTDGCSSVYSSQSRSFFLQPAPRLVDVDARGRVTMLRRLAPCQAPGQAAIAPSRMLSDGSGTSRSSVTSCTTPSPWHRGQAPAAVLGENASASSRAAPARIGAGARVEHPQQVGQRGEGADRRARARRAAALLQGHGRRQPGDLLHVRGADLLQQPAGVRRDRLEVAALRLGVERAERQRGLARTGDAR